jgi:hypothetical protein
MIFLLLSSCAQSGRSIERRFCRQPGIAKDDVSVVEPELPGCWVSKTTVKVRC